MKFFTSNKSSGDKKSEPGDSESENTNSDEEPSGHSVDKALADTNSSAVSPAPVVHLATSSGALLLDYPHGQGRIVVLSDPFIVANDGIGLKDNLRLTINLLSSSAGLIAFDEFHQGRGTTHNAFASYFAG